LAEDPGLGESFGLNHFALLADGLLRAQECGAQAIAARLQQVVARFAEAETYIMTLSSAPDQRSISGLLIVPYSL
jgi:hypothetical protein